MKDFNTIEIHKGLKDIRFGMNESDILNLLKDEHNKETDEYGDIEISFPSLQLKFTLWKDFEYKLGYIESERNELILLGQQLIGSNKNKITCFIKKDLKSHITEINGCVHEDGDIQEWLECDSLTFWFINDKLYQIC